MMSKKIIGRGERRGRAIYAALLLAAVSVFGTAPAQAGIADTKHNLGTSTANGNNSFSGTGEICVFCHTPHGSETSAAVPLWNRSLAAPDSYTTYNSLGTSSLDGVTQPVGSVSLACLSCHDGTQAMNVMMNAPGSGLGTAVTGGYSVTGTWSGARNTSGKINSVANLGQDLKNDHPIGIQYAGGPSGSITQPTGATVTDYSAFRDPDFKAAKGQLLNGKAVWWVDTSGAGTREKVDMQLYTRTGNISASNTTQIDQPYVECASCHDPHMSTNNTFLRVSNEGSGVCLSCHIK